MGAQNMSDTYARYKDGIENITALMKIVKQGDWKSQVLDIPPKPAADEETRTDLVINFKNGPIAHYNTSCTLSANDHVNCTNTLTVSSTDVPWKAMIIGAEKYEKTKEKEGLKGLLPEYQAKRAAAYYAGNNGAFSSKSNGFVRGLYLNKLTEAGTLRLFDYTKDEMKRFAKDHNNIRVKIWRDNATSYGKENTALTPYGSIENGRFYSGKPIQVEYHDTCATVLEGWEAFEDKLGKVVDKIDKADDVVREWLNEQTGGRVNLPDGFVGKLLAIT